jgi:hypothetical protein
MANQSKATEDSSRVWAQIDGTNANVIGKRVFYNHPQLGKCYAVVTGVTGEHNKDNLTVFKNDGSGFDFVTAGLSDDRSPGTYALANDGDLTDNPNTPRPEQPPVFEQVVDQQETEQGGNVVLTEKQLRKQARKNK